MGAGVEGIGDATGRGEVLREMGVCDVECQR